MDTMSWKMDRVTEKRAGDINLSLRCDEERRKFDIYGVRRRVTPKFLTSTVLAPVCNGGSDWSHCNWYAGGGIRL